MGLFDWVLKRLRGQSTAEVEDDAPAEPVAPPVREAAARARATVAADRKAVARRATKPRPEPSKPRKARKKSKKKRKTVAVAPPPAAADPAVEVLTVEEAERRYGQLFPDGPQPVPAPLEATDEDAAEAATETEVDDAPAPRAPVDREPERDPEAEARRLAATENRRRARVPRLEALLSEAQALLAVEAAEARHLRSVRQRLTSEWKRVGAPPDDEAPRLNAERDAVIEELDARLQAADAIVEAEHREHLAQRQAIVDEARALAEREDLKGAGPEMGALRAKLRAAGRVRKEDAAALDEAFKAAEARLAARRKELHAARDEARAAGMARLEQLAAQAQSLANAPDPEAAADRAKHLQATWKTIRVPGPRGETDAVWTRFRAACDAVFARRTEARVEASRATLARLEEIVVTAEHLAVEGVDGDPDDVIGRLLTDWKRAGRAPREARDPLWERLGRAFDQLRAPPTVDLPDADEDALQFRPFQALAATAPADEPAADDAPPEDLDPSEVDTLIDAPPGPPPPDPS